MGFGDYDKPGTVFQSNAVHMRESMLIQNRRYRQQIWTTLVGDKEKRYRLLSSSLSWVSSIDIGKLI